MATLTPPFSDSEPANTLILERGAYYFLKVAVKRGGALMPLHADSWLLTDLAVIKDPDGADVTAAWVTNAIDPAGVVSGASTVSDTYDANHATYKGDLATPDNIGLFSDDLGHVALKILVPSDAEDTYLNSARSYSITWKGKLSDGAGGTVEIGPSTETFDVAPPGTFLFAGESITAAEVTKGISTSMDVDQIADIVSQVANDWFTGGVIARAAGTLTVPLTYIGPNGRRAIILKARSEIFTFDHTAGVVIKKIREGPDQIEYGAVRDTLIAKWDKEAQDARNDYYREVLGRGKPFISKTDRAHESETAAFEGFVLVG